MNLSKPHAHKICLVAFCVLFSVALSGCTPQPQLSKQATQRVIDNVAKGDMQDTSAPLPPPPAPTEPAKTTAEQLRTKPNIIEDYRPSFIHGDKPVVNQKYIVLHDTEGDGDPASVISWWDANGNLVASHFIVGKDGSIYQCVAMEKIAHHAGYGDIGHNQLYGIIEDGRDDMNGSVPIGGSFPDYGMNAWSIGIEMVHVGGSGFYPEEQLNALDKLIAYIDAYYDEQGQTPSQIIDHKAWRSGNSDTSPEFAIYLSNYQQRRAHTSQ